MKYLIAVIACVAVLIGIGWVVTTNDLAMTAHFAPKYEAVRRETFEQSKAYNQGQVQELQNMQFEYVRSKPEQQAALASIILQRAADYDEARLPQDLRSFVAGLRASATRGTP